MRVLLVHPDFQRSSTSEKTLRESFNPPALGINLLAEILRGCGHDVDVLDSLRLALRYGVRAMPTFEEEVDRLAREASPDAIGFNVTSPTRLIALRCAQVVKSASPSAHIIFGGPHSTILGRRLLDRYVGLIDAVVAGDGEKSLPLILEAIASHNSAATIAGVSWIRGYGGRASIIKSLDCYPFPTYPGYRSDPNAHLFDTVPVSTARGCPYRCSFCYLNDSSNGTHRNRHVKGVLDEIQYGLQTLGCKKIHFNDDVFTLPLDRPKAILRGMLARGLRASMYSTTRIDTIDEEFISLYQAAGGGCIYFGIESGSERLRNAMRKRLSDADIDAGMEMLRRHSGIRVGFFLMLGYPGEEKDDVAATETLLRRTQPDEVTCNIAHVHPGTELFSIAVRQGKYDIRDWLSDERDFFPFERDPQRLDYLHRTCLEFETRFGRPVQRGGLIRDAGSIAYGVATTASARSASSPDGECSRSVRDAADRDIRLSRIQGADP
jgi:radical SAM superfamily enzyme YgiQ (UPF0313 family)